ncbi:MAG TPA: ABC transporter permease [Acidimicrobiales bacterium]|nr:ABC transporter permease [Acidimicrobiales bacterium]
MTAFPRLVRAELYKFRTTPGPWVCMAVVVLLTGLGVTTSFINGDHGVVHFSAPTTTEELRRLMGAGYTAAIVMAPILGVLCITTEYRHHILTSTLLAHPRRADVLGAKVVASALWGLFMGVVSFAMLAAMGIPLLLSEGGSLRGLLDQVGPVVPGMFAAFLLLAIYGMGIGTLVRNQIAGVILALGLTLVLEPIIVAIFSSLAHMDVNFLPTRATQAIAGGLTPHGPGGAGATGTAHLLLSWWLGAVALVVWGAGTAVVGYYTTFRRDVT